MIKKLFLCASFLLVQTYLVAQTVTLNNYGGWLESAFITWQPVVGAESYNVYYSGEGVLNQKIDNSLIRGYNTYLRADILGLKAGSYTITVKSVTLGVEDLGTTTPQPVTVLAQDRSGFAFANGRVPGGYTMDGTPKPNAVILYITEATKNTVSLNVTAATSNPCIGLQTILDGFKKGNDTRPLIIRLVGQITDPSYTLNGDIVIENKQNASSHITFEGVGDDAVADGWGIRIKNATNIEIRNIGTMN
ncbi:MAG TPA: pectate lyase, partial [Mariniflexile sp.]|nr:pectate lyase [Mariniflexile sp.]